MAVIGVSKPYYGIYNFENDIVSYTGAGVLGRATQVNVEIESSDDNNLYADNAIAETDRSFAGGTLTVGTDDLSQEVSRVILGLKEQALPQISGVSDQGVKELIFDDTQLIPYLGVGFVIKKKVRGVLKWRAVVLTKVMFSVPSDAATTQGESIEWQVPELTATIMRDDTVNHMWKREATFTTEAQAVAYLIHTLSLTIEPPVITSDATLSALTIGDLALTPAFAPATVNYTATADTAAQLLTATPADPNAIIEASLNGVTVENGGTLTLESGENSLIIQVTASDEVTEKTYNVALTLSA